MEDSVASDILISNWRCCICFFDIERYPYVLHFFCDCVTSKSVAIRLLEGMGLSDIIWNTYPKLEGLLDHSFFLLLK